MNDEKTSSFIKNLPASQQVILERLKHNYETIALMKYQRDISEDETARISAEIDIINSRIADMEAEEKRLNQKSDAK